MPSDAVPEALSVAITLYHLPAGIRGVRARALPEGMRTVLRIAAGEAAALDEAERLTSRTQGNLREIASFAVEQTLLLPGADSYRVLGAGADASDVDLRAHLALLLKWLHPDLQRPGERSDYARRVTRAWGDLKTPERRARYDSQHAALNLDNCGSGSRTRGLQNGFPPGRSPRNFARAERTDASLPRLLRSLLNLLDPFARRKS